MSDDSRLMSQEHNQCGHCGGTKNLTVTGDFRIYVYPEIIQPIMEEEGVINSIEDLRDLCNSIEIARQSGGSGQISCPCCR